MNPIRFMLGAIFIIAIFIVIAGGTLFLTGVIVDGIGTAFGGASMYGILALMLVACLAAVRFAAHGPDLDINFESMRHLPPPKRHSKPASAI